MSKHRGRAVRKPDIRKGTVPIWLCLLARLGAADCNGNGRDDAEDLARTRWGLVEIGSAVVPAPPSQMLLFDLDLDGDADVVSMHGDRNGLAIVESLGGGRFAAPHDIALPAFPRSLEAADLDGDLKPELIVSSFESGEVVLLRATAGTQHAIWRSIEVATSRIQATRALDVDLDGDLDLAVLNQDSRGTAAGRVTLFWNDAGGTLTQGESISTIRFGPFDLLSYDLDLDGDRDLVTLNFGAFDHHLSDLSLLVHQSTRFEPAADFPILSGSFSSIREIQLAGESVVMAVSLESVSVLERGPSATLRPLTSFRFPVGTTSSTIQDWTGDGSDDVLALITEPWVCPYRSSSIAVFPGGRSGFEPELGRVKLKVSPHAASLADVSGDGTPELVLALSEEPRIVAQAMVNVPLAQDCDLNGVLDECEITLRDCNQNDVLDTCDLASGTSADCDGDATPDECELDCDSSGSPDACDIAQGRSSDCNRNGVPDSCETNVTDHDKNGVPDDCDIAAGRLPDCNSNGLPDGNDVEPTVRFSCPEILDVGSFGGPWTSGDLDGDGRPDIVRVGDGQSCAGGVTEVRVLLNTRLGWVESERLRLPQLVSALAVADFDGDGDADLAVNTGDSDPVRGIQARLRLFANDGNGRFKRSGEVPAERLAENLFTGDFDLDGDIDLLVGGIFSSGPTCELFLNLGAGRFSPGSQVVRPDPWEVHFVVDLNQDGAADIIAAPGQFRAASLFLNDGHAAFAPGSPLPIAGEIAGAKLGDVDGDDDVDIGIVEMDPIVAAGLRLAIYRNQGSATFDASELSPWSPDENLLDLADMDGDQDIDALGAVVDRDWCRLAAHPNDGSGRFGASRELSPFREGVIRGTMDWDGDGLSDLAIDSVELEILRILPARGPAAPRILPFPLGEGANDIFTADLDGDGAPDLLAAMERKVGIHWGRGLFEFDPIRTIDVDSNPRLARAADLNGDGRLDIVTANYLPGELPGNVSILLNDGGRLFADARNYGIEREPHEIEALDLDGDQDLDLAVANNPGSSVTLLWNAGDATIGRIQPVALPGAPRGLAAGDFDGDGALDLATLITERDGVGNEVARKVGALWNDQGRLEPRVEATIEEDGQWIMAADFDRDGRSDLAVTLGGSGGLVLLRGLAARKLAPPKLAAASRRNSGFFELASDIDGDGGADVTSIHGGFLDVCVNDGHGGFSKGTHFDLSRNVWRYALEDLTQDGLSEVVGLSSFPNEILLVENLTFHGSRDGDRDGVPDECAPGHEPFVRGDSSVDGRVDIADPIAILRHLFLGGAPPACLDAADANDDGAINLTDAVRILGRLFLGDGPLPEPRERCGNDPTQDALGCQSPGACRQ